MTRMTHDTRFCAGAVALHQFGGDYLPGPTGIAPAKRSSRTLRTSLTRSRSRASFGILSGGLAEQRNSSPYSADSSGPRGGRRTSPDFTVRKSESRVVV